MRKWRWVWAGLAFVVLTVAAFVFQRDRFDPLQPLKPFVIVDDTDYMYLDSARGGKRIALSVRSARLSRADWNHVLDVLGKYAGMNKTLGPMRTRDMTFTDQPGDQKTLHQSFAVWETAKGWDGDTIKAWISHDLKEEPGRIDIEIVHVLSPWEVWQIRAKNFGHDPFWD